MKHYDVVAAVVLADGKALCMQKGTTRYAYTTGKFEFPGGKIETSETPQQALRRELLEEMDYEVEVGDELVTVVHSYPDFSISLKAFICTAPRPHDFKLKEHTGFKWLGKDELQSVDWAEADKGIVKALSEAVLRK